jgi:hypothetical protein
VLEQQCSELARQLAETCGGSFALFLFDFGHGGHGAFSALGEPGLVRLGVERFVREGCALLEGTPAQEEALRASARRLAQDLRRRCPAGVGYALLLLADDGAPVTYLSSAVRDDVRRFLAEWLRRPEWQLDAARAPS